MTVPDAKHPTTETPPPAAPAAHAARRGFLSSQVRATLATAAAVALLGLASVPWLLASPSRISGLVARAMPQLKADVRFGSVKLGWLGPLVLEDIHVVPHDGGREAISIRRVEISHGLAGILLSLGDLGRLRVEGLEADVVFDAERNSNLKKMFQATPAAIASDDPAADGPQPASHSPVRMQLDVVNAIVRIAGPWSAEQWVSDPINVRARLAPSANGPWSEWNVEPVQLLADARLEPAVAQGVLAYIAPVMADATRTGGRFSLRLEGATLPVGAPEGGRLSGVLSMHAVDLGPGPLVMNIIRSLPFTLPAPPAIRIADQSHVEFHLADRRVWHKGLEFGVPLSKPGQRLDLQSSGSVGLDDKSLDLKLELPIPADLPQDRPLLASLAGRTFSVRIGGILGEPRVNFDGSLRATAGDVVAELVGRLRGKGQPPVARPPQAAQPAAMPQPQPPAPAWRPNAEAAPVPTVDTVPKADTAADSANAANGEAAATGGSDQAPAAAPSTAERIQSAFPPDAKGKTDATTDAVIDLVGGVLEEVAKRRAERQAAEAASPQPAPPPRRGRLLRRLMQPQAPAPVATPPLQPIPQTPAVEAKPT
jgi:hypothetical protein